MIGGWPTLSLISTPGGAPSLSRFLRQGGDFDSLSSRDGLLRCRDCLFESFPNEPRIRDTARFCASLHGREQRLRQAHVDLFILPLELKPHWLKLRKIKVRQVLGQKRLGSPIGFQAGRFLSHKLLPYFGAP